MTGFAVLTAYDGSLVFTFQKSEANMKFTTYHETAVYYQLRTVPALFSSSASPLLYLAMRFAGFTCLHSLIAGILLLTDTSILIQGRFILTDGPLHFFFVFAIAASQFAATVTAHSRKWIFSIIATSFAFAFAVTTKMTAGGLIVIIIGSLTVGILRNCSLRDLFRWSNLPFLLPFAITPAILHTVCCYIHVIRGAYHSADSRMYPSWATAELKDTVGEPVNKTRWIWDPMFYFRFRQILTFPTSYLMSATDDKSSHFYQWPILRTKWFGFDDKDRRYSCAGQPFLWPVGYAFVIIATVTIMLKFIRGKMTDELARAAVFVAGFWSSFLPFIFVTRTTYLYHYTLPSIVAICASLAFINAVLSRFWATFLLTVWCFMSVFGLALFSPLVYGATSEQVAELCWSRMWC
jgi:dolichyl-phosphate-mannose-protein mannosyltransferase